MSDYIKREDAIEKLEFHIPLDLLDDIKDIPSEGVAPVMLEEDGTLWVTVGDCEKVGRVIVKNEQGHFCRVFYMGDGDEEPVRHGRWIELAMKGEFKCSVCGRGSKSENTFQLIPTVYWNYCPNCGARMDEEANA